MGQPPLPGHGLDGVHVDGVDVGSFFAVDLDGHEAARSRSAAVCSSSKDSWAMTWHQWHDE